MVKFIGSVVLAVALVVVINIFGDLVFTANEPEPQVRQLAEKTADDAATTEAPAETTMEAAPAAAPAQEPAEAQVQVAGLVGDPAAGEKALTQCKACHTFEEGGPARVGPNLWNIVGADIAGSEGFSYSDALAGIEGTWTIEALDQWLESPKDFAPGNKMTFAGVKDEATRKNIIAYLQMQQPEGEIGQTAGAPAAEAASDTAEPDAAEAEATGAAPAETDTAAAGGLVGDPAAGKKVSRQCAACHTFDEGGPHRVGPNLWNVVGSDIAAAEGYSYSQALQGVDGTWTVDALSQWLESPKDFAPRNKMTFAGVKDETDRNNLIAYLQTLQPDGGAPAQ